MDWVEQILFESVLNHVLHCMYINELHGGMQLDYNYVLEIMDDPAVTEHLPLMRIAYDTLVKDNFIKDNHPYLEFTPEGRRIVHDAFYTDNEFDRACPYGYFLDLRNSKESNSANPTPNKNPIHKPSLKNSFSKIVGLKGRKKITAAIFIFAAILEIINIIITNGWFKSEKEPKKILTDSASVYTIEKPENTKK